MDPSAKRRVVVTGIGAVSPLGLTMQETWQGIAAGRSGVTRITRFDPEGFESAIAGEVKGWDGAERVGRKEARRMDRYTQFAMEAARQAAAEAQYTPGTLDQTRVGAYIATGMGAMETIEQTVLQLREQGPRRIGPFFASMSLANIAAGMVAIAMDARGPSMTHVSACASAGHAIGEAFRQIRGDGADLIFAGGAEAPVTPVSVAGFAAMGALSKRNDEPERASRPFDAERDGFVIAEGAAVLVLEELQHALARGATVLGEIVGYGTTDDAHHIVQPDQDGSGIARAISLALCEAELNAADIGYVNAHGTSTQMNEKFETLALKAVFGAAAYDVPVSSTKSMTGHLLGAAGALESAICLCAMQNGLLPPTINQDTPDPECDLDYVPNQAREADVEYALSNSMGFGGHNVALVFSRAR
jgi:3-oxoacyl-[acyl-carrier-protein] synthase II